MNCGKRMGRMKETKKFKDNWQKYFGPALGIGAVFLIWYLVCRMEVVSAYVLPSPARVWTSFLKMVKTGELWRDISISFLRVMKGFAIAFLFAFVLGMFRALFPGGSVYYEYIVQFFRNVPPLSMIPLLILWCGIGETTKTVIIVLASLFPDVLKYREGIYRVRFESFWKWAIMFGYSEAPQIFPHHSALCDGRYSGRNADRAWL